MPQLDSLRTFAVAAVLIEHFSPHSVKAVFHFGASGVRLFFVLSGFLITGILLRCKYAVENNQQSLRSAIGHFYMRRSLRIFPIYYLTIIVILLIGQPPIADTIIWHLTYTSNYLFAKVGFIPHFGHIWSLAVEEQFYICWPAIILLTPRKYLIRVVLLTIAVGPIFRLYCLLNYGLGTETRGILTFACLDSLGIGALLAICVQQEDVGKSTPMFCFFVRHGLWIWICFFGIYSFGSSRYATAYLKGSLGDLVYSLLFAWLVAGASIGFRGVMGWVLETGVLMYLGRISYGIYLYHNLMPLVAPALFRMLHLSYPVNPYACFAVLTVMTLLTAITSWHLIEYPLNKLKDYFAYDRPTTEPMKSSVAE